MKSSHKNKTKKTQLQLPKDEYEMVKRMQETKDYIVVGVGNLFWANQNHPGCLIKALTCEEKITLTRLESKGIIAHESITKHIV